MKGVKTAMLLTLLAVAYTKGNYNLSPNPMSNCPLQEYCYIYICYKIEIVYYWEIPTVYINYYALYKNLKISYAKRHGFAHVNNWLMNN